MIAQAYGGGTWQNPGIGSSLAAANPSAVAVGYAEASALGLPLFLGEPVDDSSVLVRTTRVGDANLSGMTDLADFSLLAASFNAPASWADGDFNYDLIVDLADFSLLAANFNQALPADLPRGLVPEPSGAVALLAIPMLFLRRRPD